MTDAPPLARRVPIVPLVAGLVGVLFGVALGNSIRFASGASDNGSLIPATFMPTLTAAGIIVILLVVGGVLLIPRSTRCGGVVTLLAATGVILGLALGLMFGSSYQPSRQLGVVTEDVVDKREPRDTV